MHHESTSGSDIPTTQAESHSSLEIIFLL